MWVLSFYPSQGPPFFNSALNMEEQIQTLQAQLQQLTSAVQTLHQENQSLSNQLSSVAAPTAPSQPIAPPGSTQRHINKPPEFDGTNRHFCATFISHLKLYIHANPDLFPSEQSKVLFAASYLRGNAFAWFEPHLLVNSDPLTTDFQQFLDALLANLGDPDRHRSLTRQLQTLKQTGSASTYATSFFRLATFLKWNDEALKAQFYSGLKPQVKDALALRDKDPATTQELSELAIRLDNRIFERKSEIQPAYKPPQASWSSHPTPSPSTAPQPMDLDANHTKKHKPLTPEERQQRRSKNLCLYCGDPHHFIQNCPLRKSPWKPKPTISATTQAPGTPTQDASAQHLNNQVQF